MGNTKSKRPRDTLVGAAIGGLAFVAMGITAAAGVALSGVAAGTVVGYAIAVVAAAVGAPLVLVPDLALGGAAAMVEVRLHVVATGVAMIGAFVVALGFRRKSGVEVLIGAVAAFVVPLGIGAVVFGGGGLSVEPSLAVLFAAIGIVVVWALCRVPAVVRPALSATVRVLGVAVVITAAVGVVVARLQDAPVVGAVLLAAPSALFAAITAGLGVGWSVHLDPQVARMFGAVVPEIDLPVWPFTVLAVVLLLVCGTLAAARTVAATATDLVLLNGLLLGLVFAVTSAAMVLLASADADLRVVARGFVLVEASAGVAGSVWTAVPLGFVAGAVAGAVGALAVVAVRRSSGPYAGRIGVGGADGPVAGGRGRSDVA